ncbi:PAS domain-containing protein [Massilia forsythiae]|uniref:histidine kinase n=1 Tax=Massilia forsythiae TaxID=2728020 RepID=A0A7Z2W1D5_9BURK|nr:PAS domain-containing protein [Massilia forsythiae]QJE02615.1 PAS domain-containing protein [Massilia forsythiae]
MPPSDQAFHRLFDASPNPYLVLDRKLHIVTANRAYLASTQRELDDIVGRWAWDAFPTDPDTLRQAVASFERVIRTGQTDTMALLRFDIPRPQADGGGFERRYWTITHTPVFGADGEVEMVMQHPVDVTEIERMREASGHEQQPQQALALKQVGLIDHARQAFEANLDLKADAERLQTLFRKAPGFMAVLRGERHVFEFVNDAVYGLLGRRDYVGRPVRDVLPELAGQKVFETLDRVYARGQEFVGYDLPVRLSTHDREGVEQRYINLIYQPIVEHGRIAGIFVEGTDVTEQHLARALAEDRVAQLQRAEQRLAFQLELADGLRPLRTVDDMIGTASRLLGQRLGLARVVFAQVAAPGPVMTVSVRRDWVRQGLPSVSGIRTGFDDFYLGVAGELRAGREVRVSDVTVDARARAYLAAYETIDVRSHMSIPLVRSGQVNAVLCLHHTVPHEWTDEELRMALDMGERTWAAVEATNAQAALDTERDHSRHLFDSMTEGIGLIDRDWNVVRMNAAGLALVEKRAHEVVGRNHWDVFPDTVGTDIERMLRRAHAGEEVEAAEFPYPLAGGAIRWIEAKAFPALDGGVTSFFRDVTARRQAEDQLRRTAEHLRFTLDAAQLGEWDHDLASHTARRSPRHDQCFGYAEPVATWNLALFLAHLHPDDRARVEREFHAAVAEAGVWRTETRVVWPDGSVHWLAIFGTVYLAGGKPQRMAGIVFEISERKRIEEQLRLEGRRKDEFLAMLAHELRNPLAPIGAAADLLALGRLDAAQVKRTSTIITRQVGHMTSLINDLLDVSRVTRGLVTLDCTPVEIADIVADAVEQVRPLVQARRHRLDLGLAPGPALVAGDRKRLVQVLANLLGNAAKYTPDGGDIALRVTLVEGGAGAAGSVLLDVVDNGIGMAPEVRRGAFELFTQAERTPDRSQGGLGIGLALVKSLVELHGGSVAAHSEGPGQGSRFTVVLPRLAAPAVPANCCPGQAGMGAAASGSGSGSGAAGMAGATGNAVAAGERRSVLLVDDNVDAAQLLAMVLEDLGHRVAVEHDSGRALALAGETVPDVCILDIGLPDMDGNELARRLRALPQMRASLLIALTGYGHARDRDAALAAGFDHHLVKPVDVRELSGLLG